MIMSVITTNMDMPDNCYSCEIFDGMGCPIIQKSIHYDDIDKRDEDCPLKSVEGLIEKIEHKRKYLGDYSESYGLEEAVEIIKEYCGMEG